MPLNSFEDDIVRPDDPNFTHFPKQTPEDTVSYAIYYVPSGKVSPSPQQSRNRLNQVQTSAVALEKKLLNEYIWQRQPFQLSLKHAESVPGQWYLDGSTDFGDSIADEWLIVYLLRELSVQFSDIWVTVTDADGQFLLVEAANALPRWLNPDVADHRVWIHNGQLRLISQRISKTVKEDNPKLKTQSCTLSEALGLIASNPHELGNPTEIEAAAFHRLRNYPAQISQSMHTARVTIPSNLAWILHRVPAHISPAVEAFYLRDPVSLRTLQGNDKSSDSLRFSPEDLVDMSVRFTRVGYAQMTSQEFEPPAGWKASFAKVEDDAAKKRLDLGMKISCGFEMLVSDPQNQDKRSVREIDLLLGDLSNGEESLPTDNDMQSWSKQDDDDKWLDVRWENFERELNGQTKGKGPPGEFGDQNAQDNLRNIVEQFEKFLSNDTAGPDGIDFDDDDFDDGEEEEEEEEDEEDEDDIDDAETAKNLERPSASNPQADDNDELINTMRAMMNSKSSSMAPFSMPETLTGSRVEELDDDDDDEDDEQALRELSQAMEAELRQAGALNLDAGAGTAQRTLAGGTQQTGPDDADADPRHLFAKNFLEALRSQAGATGPAGNIMRSMGLDLPRSDGG